MVSFICDACGNSVKKNQVEKHYTNQCRNCSVLSCIDCGVDFPGDSYMKHTSCITEAEKYQGHLYQAKDKENKGEAKQKEWLKHVHGASGNIVDPKLKGILKKLSAYSNIPRKRKKFENFCKNSVNVYDAKTLDQLWDLFNANNQKESNITAATDAALEHANELEENNTPDTSDKIPPVEILNKEDEIEVLPVKKPKKSKKKKDICNIINDDIDKVNGIVCNDEDTENNGVENKNKQKSRKHKLTDDGALESEIHLDNKIRKIDQDGIAENHEAEANASPQRKFHWHKAIKVILKKSEDHEMSVKKLRKKVLTAYGEHGIDHRAATMDESRALFDKKLKTYPKVKILKDIVKLVK